MTNIKKYITILLTLCIICILCLPSTSNAAKTIKLETGETYKINVKKSKRIKVSNKKVLKVNKKGKVTALKPGKCIIKVVTKNKVKKYKFRVSTSSMEDVKPTNVSVNETPSPTPAVYNDNGIDGGIIMISPYTIENIVKIDDVSSYVYLRYSKGGTCYIIRDEDAAKGVDTICIISSNQRLTNGEFAVGDTVSLICETKRISKTIENNICKITRGLSLYYKI